MTVADWAVVGFALFYVVGLWGFVKWAEYEIRKAGRRRRGR